MAALKCLEDTTELIRENSCLKCNTCGGRYPIDDDVVRFLDTTDDFYENTYLNKTVFIPKKKSFVDQLKLWLINSGYLYYITNYFKPESRLLELGCASGISYFGKRYEMAGADISFASLRHTASIYNLAIQADLTKSLPFFDNTFDGIISSFFWEHIPYEKKIDMLKENHRILSDNGKLVFLFDVASQNILIKRLRKKNQKLYQQIFIDRDGHLGYHTIDENIKLVTSNGFKLIKIHGFEKTMVQSPPVFKKMIAFGGWFSKIGELVNKLDRNGFYHIHIFITRVIDSTFGKLFSNKKARVIMIVAEKK